MGACDTSCKPSLRPCTPQGQANSQVPALCCPHCGGNSYYQDWDREYYCVYCGCWLNAPTPMPFYPTEYQHPTRARIEQEYGMPVSEAVAMLLQNVPRQEWRRTLEAALKVSANCALRYIDRYMRR